MTNSNKMILFVLGFLLLGLLYYFVPYKMMTNSETILKTEVAALQTEYNQLSQDLLQKDFLIEETELFNKQLLDLEEMLPQDLPQENMIALVNDIEGLLELNVSQFNMSDEIPLTTYQDPTNPEIYDTSIMATMSTNLSVTYDQLIDLLNYINNNPYRMVLKDLSLVSNIETGEIATTINLETYGLKISTRDKYVIDMGEFRYGKGTIFEPYGDYSENFIVNPSVIVVDEDAPDFIIMLEPLISDRTTTLIGKSGDITATTYITNEDENVVAGTVEFYQVDGVYYYKYKLPTRSYPENYNVGIPFEPGEELELQIFSKDRVDATDISGLNLEIINTTDMVVNIVYYSEDFDNPRFTYQSESEVVVH